MSRIFGEVEDWFHRREHHPPYNDPATPPAPEAPMSLATIAEDLKTRIEGIDGEVHTFLSDHLPHLLDVAQAVEASPLVQVALSAVLPPAVEAEIVALIAKLHEQFAPAPVAATAATAVAEENLHAGEPLPAPVPAGPVVGGQAQ